MFNDVNSIRKFFKIVSILKMSIKMCDTVFFNIFQGVYTWQSILVFLGLVFLSISKRTYGASPPTYDQIKLRVCFSNQVLKEILGYKNHVWNKRVFYFLTVRTPFEHCGMFPGIRCHCCRDSRGSSKFTLQVLKKCSENFQSEIH